MSLPKNMLNVAYTILFIYCYGVGTLSIWKKFIGHQYDIYPDRTQAYYLFIQYTMVLILDGSSESVAIV